jgi:hypothetical protein
MNAPVLDKVRSTGEVPADPSTNLQKETATEVAYHELYLLSGSIEYISPVSFEDGMDWHECELYYACISNGMMEHRLAFHMEASDSIPTRIQRTDTPAGWWSTAILFLEPQANQTIVSFPRNETVNIIQYVSKY